MHWDSSDIERTELRYQQRQRLLFLQPYPRGAQILGAWYQWPLNFVRWRLIFVYPQYGTCFMSPLWRLEI
jgi:hypothetical protein